MRFILFFSISSHIASCASEFDETKSYRVIEAAKLKDNEKTNFESNFSSVFIEASEEMKATILIFILSIAVHSLSANLFRNERITGGQEALPNQFPWQVGIGVFIGESDVSNPVCGGALISERTVITAGETHMKYLNKLHRNVSTSALPPITRSKLGHKCR